MMVKYTFVLSHGQLLKNLRTLYKFKNSKFKIENRVLNYVTDSKPSNHSSDLKFKHPADWGDIITQWYKKYQNFVGITEILEAQEKVTTLTDQLFAAQSKRRKLQNEVESIHQQLLATHQRITKSELYSEDHYSLFERARELNGTLKTLQAQFIQTEEEERSLFTRLSTAIQFCHEKERTQSENSKYWSILISVISATLASLITSINNWVRIKEIKDHSLSLHKDNLAKTEGYFTAIYNSVIGKGAELVSNNKEDFVFPEAFVEAIKSTLREELNCVLKENGVKTNIKEDLQFQEGNVLPLSPKHQDVSYTKIASSMLIGAILGTLITAGLFGSTGGT